MFEFLYGWLLWIGVGAGAALMAVGIPAYRRAVFVYRLEGQIPQALRVVSDAVAAGMDLKSAFEAVAALGLSPMNQVFRRVLLLSDFGGLTAEEALWRVASELPSANFRRFALIVAEAARSGARLPEVLDVAARTFASVVDFRRELWSQLRPYVALFYAVILVFVALSDVIVYLLLPQLAQLSVQLPSLPAGGGLQVSTPAREDVLSILFLTSLVQSVVGGAIVGRIAYFSPRAGLLHGGVAALVSTIGLLIPSWL
ncbi:MAG: type II secretion system F family protein [Thermoproteus sp.]